MKNIKITELLIFIVGAELVGALSGILVGDFTKFYSNEPALSPPNWLFPVVWTILYALMGISAYLIYSSDAKKSDKNKALTVFGIQLFFNFLWSIAFFRIQSVGFALVIIIILLAMIAVMIYLFYKVRPVAAYLNIPYLLWVAFATYLNFAILLLN